MKNRIVVVGLGSIGRRHVRLLKEREDISVELFEPDENAMAFAIGESGNLPNHSSFDEMLKTKPYAVVIATPHTIHADQAIRALEAGAAVLCEKPMSDSLSDAKRMRDAAKKTGKVLVIGFQLHFYSGLIKLTELVQSGELGTILHAHARVGTYITLVNSKSRYQSRQKYALLYDYAHQPDMLYWILGEQPVAVYASAIEAGELEFSSNPNVIAITCEYERQLISTIHLNYVQMPERHEYEIVGDKGWAILNYNECSLKVGTASSGQIQNYQFSFNRDDFFRSEHQAFFDTILGKRSAETSAEDGLISMSVCDAAMRSLDKKVRVLL